MDGLAVGLILASAFLHAWWNLLAKRVGGGATFIWLYATLACVLYAPVVIGMALADRIHISGMGAAFLGLSTLLHALYLVVLQHGYRLGDLSVVYPVARGTGPAVATFAAITVLGERPPVMAIVGASLVIIGVILLTTEERAAPGPNLRAAVVAGLQCGLLIAAYTVCDKYAVAQLELSPFVLACVFNLGISVLLLPAVLRNPGQARQEWQQHRRQIVVIAVLYPGAYLLVLQAMVFTPLSYVASAREISILFGAVLGARILGEGHSFRRFLAASCMVCGLVILTIA